MLSLPKPLLLIPTHHAVRDSRAHRLSSSQDLFPSGSCDSVRRSLLFLEQAVRAVPRRPFTRTANGTTQESSGPEISTAEAQEERNSTDFSESPSVLIVGGGVAGLATALALQRVGLRPLVVERSTRMRRGGAALSLWGNAWRALDALGVGQRLRSSFLPLDMVEILASDGRPLRSWSLMECSTGPPNASPSHEVRGVTRAALLEALEQDLVPGSVLYGSSIGRFRQLPGGDIEVEVHVGDSGASGSSSGRTVVCQALVGCDGVSSVVAQQLGLPRASYSGYVAARGLATWQPQGPATGSSLLQAQPGPAAPQGPAVPGSLAGAREADSGGALVGKIRMLWGRGVRAGIYPITPSLFYWFTCANRYPQELAEDMKLSKWSQKQAALSSVSGWAGQIQDLIEATPEEHISTHAIEDRWAFPAALGGRLGHGSVTLAGDAFHPMTPNLGQGACTALEDAVVLAQHLRSAATPVSPAGEDSSGRRRLSLTGRAQRVAEALKSYEARRTKRVAPLVVRSNLMGVALQVDDPLVCALRDRVVLPYLFSPAHFLDHALFDCGDLDEPAVVASQQNGTQWS